VFQLFKTCIPQVLTGQVNNLSQIPVEHRTVPLLLILWELLGGGEEKKIRKKIPNVKMFFAAYRKWEKMNKRKEIAKFNGAPVIR
jgi:hypothetical protein